MWLKGELLTRLQYMTKVVFPAVEEKSKETQEKRSNGLLQLFWITNSLMVSGQWPLILSKECTHSTLWGTIHCGATYNPWNLWITRWYWWIVWSALRSISTQACVWRFWWNRDLRGQRNYRPQTRWSRLRKNRIYHVKSKNYPDPKWDTLEPESIFIERQCIKDYWENAMLTRPNINTKNRSGWRQKPRGTFSRHKMQARSLK